MPKIQSLIRISGTALLAATILYFIVLGTHGSDYETGRMLLPIWKTAHIAEGLLYLLLTLGVVGLYLCQAEQTGILGLVGFVLALLGCAFVVNQSLTYHAFLLAFMQNHYSTLLSPAQWYSADGPLGAEFSYISRSYVVAIVGLGLMGISIARARVLPRWAGLLLAAGQVTSLINFFAPETLLRVLFPITAAGFLAIAVSYGWLGFVLTTSRGLRTQ